MPSHAKAKPIVIERIMPEAYYQPILEPVIEEAPKIKRKPHHRIKVPVINNTSWHQRATESEQRIAARFK